MTISYSIGLGISSRRIQLELSGEVREVEQGEYFLDGDIVRKLANREYRMPVDETLGTKRIILIPIRVYSAPISAADYDLYHSNPAVFGSLLGRIMDSAVLQ